METNDTEFSVTEDHSTEEVVSSLPEETNGVTGSEEASVSDARPTGIPEEAPLPETVPTAEPAAQENSLPAPQKDAVPSAASAPEAKSVQEVPLPSALQEVPENAAAPQVPQTPPMVPLRPVGLMYTPLTKKALAICFDAHKNQCDKGGLPYVFHPFHLAEQMETELEVCTALLHDVVEDSHYTFEDLRREGFPQPVLEALRLMTRDPYMHYLDYVVQLRRNPIARRVKLADLRHNSDLNRLVAVGPKDKRRLLRYRMALAILAADDYDAGRRCFCKRLPLSVEQPVFLTVYYDAAGKVLYYCVSEDAAAPSCCWFDAETGEKLRITLHPHRTLPDSLADLTPLSCQNLDGLLRHYCVDPTRDPAE